MRFSYIFRLALKNLRGHKMRTFLTAGGVAISVGFVVFLISLGLGLQRVSTNQISNLEALQILDVVPGNSKLVSINDDTLAKFSKVANVTEVVPQISLASRIKYKSSEIDGVAYGKNIDYLGLEAPKLSSGKKYTDDKSQEALVNTAAVTQLGVTNIVGSNIDVTVNIKSDFLPVGEKTKQVVLNLKVVGIIDDASASYVYFPLDLLKSQGVVNYSGAKVKASSKDTLATVKLQIENMGFKTSSIKDTVDQINQFFGIFQIILISFGGIAIIVACLGMFNTLTISLLEKTREVGFMKALGTTKRDIYMLFISESILIGGLGSLVGVLVGVALGTALNLAIAGLAKATGNIAVQLFYTPLYLAVVIIAIAIIISFFTGFYPSNRAARINALDAMRYE
jgi:putative ABC transport system permease protein